MIRVLPLFLLLLLLAPPLAPLSADEDTSEELTGEALRDQVKRWIEELRSDTYAVREAARKGLKSHGPKARDLLEAAKDDEDPEVRRTIRTLLAADVRPPIRMPVQLVGGRIGQMGLVTLEKREWTVQEAFEALARQIGASFEVPERVRAKPVSIEAQDEPCFAVLRRLLAAVGLRMPRPFDAGGAAKLVLADGSPVPPWAAAGPLLVEVTEVSATVTLNARTMPKYALKLSVWWAPSVHVAQYEAPRVEVARDARGRSFKGGPSSSRISRFGVGQSTRSATMLLHVEPTTAEAGLKLDVLEILLPLAALQHDAVRVSLLDTGRLPICLDPQGEVAEPGADETVQFKSLEKSDDGRGYWIADVAATLVDDVAQRTVQAFHVIDDGRLERLWIYGGRSRAADGTVRLTARAHRVGLERPKGLVVKWFRREEAGRLRFRLADVPLR